MDMAFRPVARQNVAAERLGVAVQDRLKTGHLGGERHATDAGENVDVNEADQGRFALSCALCSRRTRARTDGRLFILRHHASLARASRMVQVCGRGGCARPSARTSSVGPKTRRAFLIPAAPATRAIGLRHGAYPFGPTSCHQRQHRPSHSRTGGNPPARRSLSPAVGL